MKKIIYPIALVLIIAAGFLLVNNNNNADFFKAKAAVSDNVTGFAWIGADCTDPSEAGCGAITNPIGWISFNDTNAQISCSGALYGVNVNYDAPSDSDKLSGSAFIGVGENSNNADCNSAESSVGWLYFDADTNPAIPDTPTCGSNGYPADYCFAAKTVNDEVQGWAPIVTNANNILTWVRFKGSNYSIKINADGTVGTPGAGTTDHYAWSGKGSEVSAGAIGAGLGWIDFPPANGGVQSNGGVIFLPPNNPPEARNLLVNQGNYCVAPLQPILSWTFFDSDGDYPQSAYQIQVDDNAAFSPPLVVDTGKITSVSGSYAVPSGILSFNTTYYWQVMVWDSRGKAAASWTGGPSFTTAQHGYPNITFDPPTTRRIAKDEEVVFTDTSTLYGGATVGSRSWTFRDATPSASANQQETVIFNKNGSKTVTLTITDSPTGYTCMGSKTYLVKPPLPKIKEINPRP